MGVVMLDIDGKDALEVTPIDAQEAVEALAADAADPSLSERVRVRCSHRRTDRSDGLGAELCVDRGRELCCRGRGSENRGGRVRSTNVSIMLRACWVAHSPAGFV